MGERPLGDPARAVGGRREMRRIGHHVIEAGPARRGGGRLQIAFDHLDPRARARLRRRCGSRCAAAARCNSSPTIRQPGTRAARHRLAAPVPAAGVEHALPCPRRHRGGEQHRVDRHPIAVRRLAEAHPAAEQVVRRSARSATARALARPARALARALSRRSSSTIRRRGIAPMLPSTPLTWSSSTTRSIAGGREHRLRPGQMDEVVAAQ